MSPFEWCYQRKFETNIEAKGDKLRRVENSPNNGVSPRHQQNTLPLCVFVFENCTCVLSSSLQAGLLLRRMWLTREFVSWVHPHRADLGAPGVDVWLVERVGSTGIGWITGASRCLQLENTLLHSFGYSQIKKPSCITGSSHATHAWMRPVCVCVCVCVSGEHIASCWSTLRSSLHPFASC